MKVVVTGGTGFLGWHTRVRLLAAGEHEAVAVTRDNWADLPKLVSEADAVLHLAGVNRAEDSALHEGNIALAQDVADAVRRAGTPKRVIFANSIQAGNESPYGNGKAAAACVLDRVCSETAGTFVDLRLPNLFGEHGRANYNSFVATFVEHAVRGTEPSVADRQVPLLHAQRAAAELIAGLVATPEVRSPDAAGKSVAEVWTKLRSFRDTYASGDVPALLSPFDVELFNTLRAGLFPKHYPIHLTQRDDNRGRLVETVRSHGGEGQTFVSTTRPGITRGEHFHLRKIERFVVLSGRGRICLRRALTDEVVSFEVSGDRPCVVDMPTLWSHNITNIGDTEMTTLFWTNELFDADDTDTYADNVAAGPAERAGAV